jgi:hypothetical protein
VTLLNQSVSQSSKQVRLAAARRAEDQDVLGPPQKLSIE